MLKISFAGILTVSDENSTIRIQDPDPLVRGIYPRIRIHPKMAWIRNTAREEVCLMGAYICCSHTAYYLTGDLAKLELSLLNFFTSHLLDANYEPFSNPGKALYNLLSKLFSCVATSVLILIRMDPN